ncbi:Dihydroxyacetone kinase 2, partial [Bienertia sinuspersici]
MRRRKAARTMQEGGEVDAAARWSKRGDEQRRREPSSMVRRELFLQEQEHNFKPGQLGKG